LVPPGATLVADATVWLNRAVHGAVCDPGFRQREDKNAKEDETKGKKDDAKKEKVSAREERGTQEGSAQETRRVRDQTGSEDPEGVRGTTARWKEDATQKCQKRGDADEVFAGTAQALAGLSQRAHPAFRPLIADYVKVLSDIAKGDTKGVDARLKELKERRNQTLAQTLAARDPVDWA